MAYLDFTREALLQEPLQSYATSAPAAYATLKSAEHHVLWLSRRDTGSSLAAANRPDRRVLRLFGMGAPNKLADPRLEALRRFVVLLRLKGERLPPREDARLLAAGFTAAEMAEVRRLVGRETPPNHREAAFDRIVAGILVAALATQMLVYRYLAAYLDDGLLGLIGTLVATAAAIGPVRACLSLFSDAPAARAS